VSIESTLNPDPFTGQAGGDAAAADGSDRATPGVRANSDGGAPLAGPDTEVSVQGSEPCAHCGASLATDQRYCLECGAPRAYLSGLQQLDGLRATSLGAPPPGGSHHAAGEAVYQAPAYPYPPTSEFYGEPPVQQAHSLWGGPSGLIAGVGVLLLAMGVGVLIGRSNSDAGKSAQIPPAQVITVDQAGGAGATAGTETSSSQTPAPTSTTHSSKKASSTKHHSSGGEGSSSTGAVGNSIEKPAPPTVLKNEKSKSGGSYEQKSKNLPNVISTG
jgi:hypothetical protein